MAKKSDLDLEDVVKIAAPADAEHSNYAGCLGIVKTIIGDTHSVLVRSPRWPYSETVRFPAAHLVFIGRTR